MMFTLKHEGKRRKDRKRERERRVFIKEHQDGEIKVTEEGEEDKRCQRGVIETPSREWRE